VAEDLSNRLIVRRDDISKKEKMEAHQGLELAFHAIVDDLEQPICRKNADNEC
jgi:hypothetical protein